MIGEEEDSENENEISLADVYNDDLEEDNSDWNGQEESSVSEEESENEAEEEENRGIKRKIDEWNSALPLIMFIFNLFQWNFLVDIINIQYCIKKLFDLE